MYKDLSLLIGGIQGEGVISTGLNIMKTLSYLGYYTHGGRKFSSRIKGGNTTITINVSVDKKQCVQDHIDIILALDQETIQRYQNKLSNEGLLLYDSVINPKLEEGYSFQAIPLPITEIAKEVGSLLMRSTCAIGFLGRIMGITQEDLIQPIREKYGKKGEDILNKNIAVLDRAFQHQNQQLDSDVKKLQAPLKRLSRPVMIGNEAMALGALMADCRFIPSYPITPASEIMEYLGSLLPHYGGAMIQVEDEIAAVTMAIGASYAGVRSMTATSGPGISLMLEGIGLAGIIEVPLVIVDTQRAGPSTGLPTKHEQSDLFTLYYGGHGDYPSIILAPSTVEECFYDMIRGFNLADQYQCPVIVLSDLALALSPQTIDELDYAKITIDRGAIATREDLEGIQPGEFKRFAFTESGISPRSFPGMAHGGHHVTGVEHNQLGLPFEEEENRKKMMEKRLNKILPLEEGEEIKVVENGSKVLFLTLGSTFGVVEEAVKQGGNRVDYGAIKMIRPLPKKQLKKLLEQYNAVVVVENNYRKQLASIIQSELGYHHKIHSVVKYTGNPFTLGEILSKIGEWI